jgi:hypothetical protein
MTGMCAQEDPVVFLCEENGESKEEAICMLLWLLGCKYLVISRLLCLRNAHTTYQTSDVISKVRREMRCLSN